MGTRRSTPPLTRGRRGSPQDGGMEGQHGVEWNMIKYHHVYRLGYGVPLLRGTPSTLEGYNTLEYSG